MIKCREILMLAAMGVSQNSIAFSCRCAQSTVSDVLRAARAHQLSWPLPEEMDDAAIAKGEEPYMYSAFCREHRAWTQPHDVRMRVEHKPAETIQVEWVGDTGEVHGGM